MFVTAKRGVRHIGPVAAVGDVCIPGPGCAPRTRQHRAAIARLHRRPDFGLEFVRPHGLEDLILDLVCVGLPAITLGATAVVLKINEQRVLQSALPFQLRGDAPDAPIHGLDHRGIHLHALDFPLAVLNGVPLAHGGRHFPAGIKYAEFPRPFEPGLADDIVTGVVAALAAGDVLRQRMHGPVGARVGDIEEERFLRMFPGVILHELHRVVADGIRVIKLLRLVLRIVQRGNKLVVSTKGGRIVKTPRTGDRAVEPIEAALDWPVGVIRLQTLGRSDMPLASHVGAITCGPQHLGHRDRFPAQLTPITVEARVALHQADAGLMGIQAREQRSARGTTPRRVVELREADAVFRQRVQTRRGDFRAVAANVRIAHIVGENDHDVRLLLRCIHRILRCQRRDQQSGKECGDG